MRASEDLHEARDDVVGEAVAHERLVRSHLAVRCHAGGQQDAALHRWIDAETAVVATTKRVAEGGDDGIGVRDRKVPACVRDVRCPGNASVRIPLAVQLTAATRRWTRRDRPRLDGGLRRAASGDDD